MRQLKADEKDKVLVAIMNNHSDFAIARDQHWYRIPVSSAEKWLKKRWPPQWLAFYQTKVFGPEAWAVNYYARVLRIREVCRYELFPGQPRDSKSSKRYFQLFLEPLRQLLQPILSRRWRRIIFIPTYWQKFVSASEINDLYDESPLEDRLWAEFKRLQIRAERQELVRANARNYMLDFAIYCELGKINVETNGDAWHANPERAARDNLRDNDLKTDGWRVLRFNTSQVQEETTEYCVSTIAKNINKLGGIKEGKFISRKIDLKPVGGYQLGLFDDFDD